MSNQNMRFTRTSSSLLELVTILLASILTSCADDLIPYFAEEPVSQIVIINSPITLKCRVEPSDAVVRWMFNREFIEPGNSYGFMFQGTDLFIPKFRDGKPSKGGNEGVYQCTARTDLGTIHSRPATLSKAVLKRFKERDDLHLNITVGFDVLIPCQPPHSIPEATIMFKFNKSRIINGTSDHYRILPFGNLLINNVGKDDNGQYQCMAYNPLRNKTRTADHAIHVHVQDVSALSPSQKPAVFARKVVRARAGQDVMLECYAIGNPKPVITWEKYGGELKDGTYKVEHGNLVLKNVSIEDEGTTYLCKASNNLGSPGLKAVMLEIIDPPSVVSLRRYINTSVGQDLELDCAVTGKPRPKITWRHNGERVRAPLHMTGQQLRLSNIQPHDRGLYQCFGENQAGVAYDTIYIHMDMTDLPMGIETDTNRLPVSSVTMATAESESDQSVQKPGRSDRNKGHRKDRKDKRKKKKKNHKKKRLRITDNGIKLVPPSIPEVFQLSDTTVRLNWTVTNDGLPIVLFKVQYKEVAPTKGNWKTGDDELKGHIRMAEVRGLKKGGTYKFRIAAVYSNNDNKHGPNSDRFQMVYEPGKVPKRPTKAPLIVEVTPVEYEGEYGLNVKWQYISDDGSSIEGFNILFKPYNAEESDYKKLSLFGAGVRTHLIKNLLPDTDYSIVMQCFNAAGESDRSNLVVHHTTGSGPGGQYIPPLPPTQDTTPSVVTDKPNKPGPGKKGQPSSETAPHTSSEMLYMIVGIVVGVMMLFLVVFMFMCWWKQRQQRRMMDAMNVAVQSKFQDPSQRIYTDSLRKKYINGGLGMNGINGTIANGHIPHNNYHKMNINVNPLSELDQNPDGMQHFQNSTFHPNGVIPGHGTLPGYHRPSDNNFNNINRSKSLENTLHNNSLTCQSSTSMQNGDIGGGESQACPPSPLSNSVPVGHEKYYDSHQRYSNSNRSCDQLAGSHDQVQRSCDSSLSYDDTGGIHSGAGGNRHRKRKRRLHSNKEQSTKDQATNTDLSSNEGTMDFCTFNKVPEPLDSGHMDSYQRTFSGSDSPSSDFTTNIPSSEGV